MEHIPHAFGMLVDIYMHTSQMTIACSIVPATRSRFMNIFLYSYTERKIPGAPMYYTWNRTCTKVKNKKEVHSSQFARNLTHFFLRKSPDRSLDGVIIRLLQLKTKGQNILHFVYSRAQKKCCPCTLSCKVLSCKRGGVFQSLVSQCHFCRACSPQQTGQLHPSRLQGHWHPSSVLTQEVLLLAFLFHFL
jgi:hypothetical protein